MSVCLNIFKINVSELSCRNRYQGKPKMGCSFFSRMVGLVSALLILSQSQSADANILGDLLGKLCAGALTPSVIDHCSIQFSSNVAPYSTPAEDDVGRISNEIGFCCSVAFLKECIVNTLGSACGVEIGKVSSKLLTDVIKETTRLSGSNLPCTGDEYYYAKESPVCWPVWGKSFYLSGV